MILETVDISDISQDPANVRKHSDRNLEAIAASLRAFGQQKPIVVDKRGVILAGNGTYEAAKRIGWDKIQITRTDLSGTMATAYAIADNRTAELAEWDDTALAEQLRALQSEEFDLSNVGYTDDEVQQLIDGIGNEILGASEVTEDEIPEPPIEPITKPGDLWLLGEHRLLCGDSTKAEDVARVMAGSQINIAFTSPPYASQRKYDESSGFKPIPPDQYVAWFEPIAANVKSHLAADGSWFVNIKEHCEDGQRSLYVKDLAIAHVRQWAWMLVDEFVWKRKGVPGGWDNRFKNEWEPVFHFTKQAGIKFRKTAVGKQSQHAFTVSDRSKAGRESVFDCNADNGKEFYEGIALPGNVVEVNGQTIKEHNAAFPVGLPSFFIKAFTDESDTVYEPFCGSGSTLIAAEQLGRKCYGMEISPQYCDVIVKRWETLTGRVATRA